MEIESDDIINMEYLESIPRDVLYYDIFPNLSWKMLEVLCLINKKHIALLDNDIFWKRFCNFIDFQN